MKQTRRTPSRLPEYTFGDSFMRTFSLAVLLLGVATLVQVGGDAAAGDKDKKEPEKTKKLTKESSLLVLSPAGGEEVELADWKFSQGTRHFSLAKDAKPKSGP